MTEVRPTPISKKKDDVQIGQPLQPPSSTTPKHTIPPRKVISLQKSKSWKIPGDPAIVQLDHPYSQPSTVPTTPTSPRPSSEASDWNRPSTSRVNSHEDCFSLDFVKHLQAKAKYHENENDKSRRIIQRLIQEKREDKKRINKLESELSILRPKFKKLKEQGISKKDREDIIRECLKPFFKPTQIGIWQNLHRPFKSIS